MADWRRQLNGMMGDTRRSTRAEQEGQRFTEFLAQTVLPAFHEIGRELSQHGRETIIRETSASATLSVKFHDAIEISYRILRRSLPNTIVPYAEICMNERKGLRMLRKENMLRESTETYGLDDITTEEVIQNFLSHYRPLAE